MDNNGWPGEPGVPLNPERDGWHWVESAEGPVPALWARPLWRHCRDFWDQRSPEWMEEQQWRYIGPCLTPAEIDARVKEDAARLIKQTAAVLSNPSAKDSLNFVADAIIRALKGEGDE